MTAQANLLAGWLGILFGVISGAIIGLRFHEEGWAGGYGSFRRRLIRLGHISFFGLGFLNILFATTLSTLAIAPNVYPGPYVQAASGSFILGAVSMPLCCFLTAWKPSLKALFPIPVLSIAIGAVLLLSGWQLT